MLAGKPEEKEKTLIEIDGASSGLCHVMTTI